MKFHKYQGTGNDFIIIDARQYGDAPFHSNLVKSLCNRHFGIGADGLILLLESAKTDFYMKYFNSDGFESTMCGNGGRCITSFAQKLGIIKNETTFSGIDGDHYACFTDTGTVRLRMSDVTGIQKIGEGYLLDTGSPHYVVFRNTTGDIDVLSEGRRIRNSSDFIPNGTNVNFVETFGPNEFAIRTYERGVEDETLACGTGSVASAITSFIVNKTDKSSYLIHARGGQLKVWFTPEGHNRFTDVWLEGKAEFVFEGEVMSDDSLYC